MGEKIITYLGLGLFLALIVRNPTSVSGTVNAIGGATTSVFGTLIGNPR